MQIPNIEVDKYHHKLHIYPYDQLRLVDKDLSIPSLVNHFYPGMVDSFPNIPIERLCI